jgi:hypothetical protein
MMTGDTALASELLQRMRRERESDENRGKAATRRRTAAELLLDAGNAAEERRRLKAEKAAQQQAEREREAAIARARHLDQLAGREPMLWQQVEELIAAKQSKRYDEALAVLEDLRDLAARNDGADFRCRLEMLRAAHARKAKFIEKLHKAGVGVGP